VLIFAHPGNTAADGCHYCRTNCDKWGVPWNVRHCHGGGYVAPTSTPKPPATNTPTTKLTSTPTIKPTGTTVPRNKPTPLPELTETPTPTPEPEVKGEETVQQAQVIPSPTPTLEPLTAGETVTGMGVMGAIVGVPIWLVVRFFKKLKTKNLNP